MQLLLSELSLNDSKVVSSGKKDAKIAIAERIANMTLAEIIQSAC